MKRYLNLLRKSVVIPFLSLWVLGACSTAQFALSDRNTHRYEINEEIAPDPKIESFFQPYKVKFEAEMNKVIGQSALRLTKPGNQPETLLGNFFTDALMAEGKKLDPTIDFCLATKGGLRVELPEGDITVGKVFELMPFENALTILEVSGEQVAKIAEFVAFSQGQPVSGMRLVINDNKPTNITIGGKPLDLKKTYKLLTYDYLANGGDDSRGLDNPISRKDYPQKVRETLIQHISGLTAAGQAINVKLDGRVSISK